MYCPDCGAKVEQGEPLCPNGHRTGALAAVAAVASRRLGGAVRPALTLRVPSIEEAWPVVAGLKILAMITLVAGAIAWSMAAQLLASLGMPKALGGVVALGAFAAGFALYALALLLQSAVASAHGHRADREGGQ